MSLPHVAIYVRVSTTDQVEEGLSLESQPIMVLRKLDEVLGQGLYTYRVFTDEGKSGGLGPLPWDLTKKSKDRPALWEMLQGLKAGEFTHVAAYRLDRIYRNRLGYLGLYQEVMHPRGIKFILVADSFDESLTGRMAQGILAEVAEFQREQISENVKANLQFRRQQGYHHGIVPFGWRREEPFEHEGRRRNILPEPSEAQTVRRIADMYLSGMGETAISSQLNAEGITPRKKDGKWIQGTVNLVLNNPVHAGMIRGSDGGLIRGIHFEHRLYDEAVLAQIQERVDRNRRRLKGVAHTQPHRLFSGLAVCGHWGRRLQGSFHTDHPGYRCLGRAASNDGAHVYIPAKTLEDLVVAELASLARQPQVLQAIEDGIESLVRGQDSEQTSRAKAIHTSLEDLVRQEDKLVDGYGKGLLSQSSIRRRMDELEKAKLALEKELLGITASLESSLQRALIIRKAKAVLYKLDAVWNSMSDAERREALHLAVEGLTVHATEGRKWIELKFAFNEAPIEIEVLRGAERYRSGKLDGAAALTPRELAALKHVNDGADYVQIAKYFASTPANAHSTLRHAKIKLGADSFIEAAKKAEPIIRKIESQLPLYGKVKAPKHAPKRLKVMEHQVLLLAGEGRKLKDIASLTSIPIDRAESLLASALLKCGAKTAKSAMAILLKSDALLPVTMVNRRRTG